MFWFRRNKEQEQILRNEKYIMATINDLVTTVAQEDTAIDSAVQLITGLQAQIAQLGSATTDPATAAKINTLNTDITAKIAELAAAVVVNTPSVPPVTPSTSVVQPADAQAAASAAVAATAPVVTPATPAAS